jgi:hypothetical protein
MSLFLISYTHPAGAFLDKLMEGVAKEIEKEIEKSIAPNKQQETPKNSPPTVKTQQTTSSDCNWVKQRKSPLGHVDTTDTKYVSEAYVKVLELEKRVFKPDLLDTLDRPIDMEVVKSAKCYAYTKGEHDSRSKGDPVDRSKIIMAVLYAKGQEGVEKNVPESKRLLSGICEEAWTQLSMDRACALNRKLHPTPQQVQAEKQRKENLKTARSIWGLKFGLNSKQVSGLSNKFISCSEITSSHTRCFKKGGGKVRLSWARHDKDYGGCPCHGLYRINLERGEFTQAEWKKLLKVLSKKYKLVVSPTPAQKEKWVFGANMEGHNIGYMFQNTKDKTKPAYVYLQTKYGEMNILTNNFDKRTIVISYITEGAGKKFVAGSNAKKKATDDL